MIFQRSCCDIIISRFDTWLSLFSCGICTPDVLNWSVFLLCQIWKVKTRRSKLINFWWFEIALASQKIASEIEEIREKLPKLGPLTKALKIHEIMITSGGQVRSKNLPSDVFYENVKLKESRRIRRVDQHDDDNV